MLAKARLKSIKDSQNYSFHLKIASLILNKLKFN